MFLVERQGKEIYTDFKYCYHKMNFQQITNNLYFRHYFAKIYI